MKVLSAHTNEQEKQVIKAVIFDKDGVLLDLEATWLNSAIAMTHFVSELTDGRHKPKAFQAIIGIDEETRQIDANGLFAAGSSTDQFLEFVRFEPALEPLLLHDEPIYLEDKIIGRTTSGNYSFNFKKNLAFGYINNSVSISKVKEKKIFIEIEKHKYPAEILLKPLKQTNFKNT